MILGYINIMDLSVDPVLKKAGPAGLFRCTRQQVSRCTLKQQRAELLPVINQGTVIQRVLKYSDRKKKEKRPLFTSPDRRLTPRTACSICIEDPPHCLSQTTATLAFVAIETLGFGMTLIKVLLIVSVTHCDSPTVC